MNVFWNKQQKERPKTLTEGRSFLGVMVDPEVDSYFLIQSNVCNTTKSEEVRKALKKTYDAGIMGSIRNVVRKILIEVSSSSMDQAEVCRIFLQELKRQGIHKNHIEQITELLWRELKNQNR